MSTVRIAPDIPGFSYIRDLGSGGFADVYLYRSHHPDRQVAVKVLKTSEMNQRVIQRFLDEANTTAMLEHPHIVRVYGVGRTTDGRPFIQMAYLPNPSMSVLVKKSPLSVSQVLKAGVELSAAVETAHRAGLIHRDIKPANVLTDRYGDPVLTDFGIATRLDAGDDDESLLSIPWAPPEVVFSWTKADERSDVYSLGATLWHLLVGRSPFEVPGGDNRSSAMMQRIRDWEAPMTGRGDVPASLERLLRLALSKEPRRRPKSAFDLGRALLAIESELRLPATRFMVEELSASAASPPAPADDRTRRKGETQVVTAQTPIPAAPVRSTPLDATIRRDEQLPLVHQDGATPVAAMSADTASMNRGKVTGEEQGAAATPRAGRAGLVIGIVAALAVIAIVTVVLVNGIGRVADSDSPQSTGVPPPTICDRPPGRVRFEEPQRDADMVTFSWVYERMCEGDVSVILRPDGTETRTSERKSVEIAPVGTEYCIQVMVLRKNGAGGLENEWSEKGCVT